MKQLSGNIKTEQIEEILQDAGIGKKTILNYRCRIKHFLNLASNSGQVSIDEKSVEIYFQSLEKDGASKSVLLQARFALQAWFRCTEQSRLADYVLGRFRQEDPLAEFQTRIKKELAIYGEQRKLSGYRKDLCEIVEALPATSSEWSEEDLHAYLALIGENPPALKKSYWYFLLALGRADLASSCRFKFSPALPVDQQEGWQGIVSTVTSSSVLQRIYNRAAGLAHVWMRIMGVDRLDHTTAEEMKRFVLSHTGESGHALVQKSLRMYVSQFYGVELAA